MFLTELPPSLNWDEVSHGYNAYSILKTGKDEWGNTLPLIFRAYGDYKLPVYIYITAFSEKVFGLNAFAVRFPSAIAGVITVIFTYLLTNKLFLKEFDIKTRRYIASLASLLVTIEPWSLFLSRGAFEANLALTFFLAGVYFLFVGFKTSLIIVFSLTLLGLSVWTYNSYRIFVPLMLIIFFLIYQKKFLAIFRRNKKLSVSCFFVLLLFFIPMFLQLLSSSGQARYGKVTILDEGAIEQIHKLRQKSDLNPLLTRLIYNRPIYFLEIFLRNWASHFTFSFLFFKGGTNYQFSVPQHGLLYPLNLFPFVLGLVFLLKRRSKENLLILFWMLVAPVPSSLTREAPHVLRSITILPTPMLVTSLGVVTFIGWFKSLNVLRSLSKSVFIFYIFLTALFLENYLNIYFNDYKRDYSFSWQYGYKEVVEFVKSHFWEYDKVIVTKKYGEPHEFFLFFWPWDPEKYIKDPNLIRFYQSEWYWVDRFDKFYFVNDWDIPKDDLQDFKLESGGNISCLMSVARCLLATSPGSVPKGWKKLEVINFLDGKTAFEIYEN